MPTPEETSLAFLDAFNAHDIDKVMSFYTADAVFVNEDGRLSEGVDAMRPSLDEYMKLEPRLTITKKQVIPSGEVVVTLAVWTMEATAPDGSPIRAEGRGFDVMRRQPDGSWKMIVDSPWGAASLG